MNIYLFNYVLLITNYQPTGRVWSENVLKFFNFIWNLFTYSGEFAFFFTMNKLVSFFLSLMKLSRQKTIRKHNCSWNFCYYT